jgi:hypothetical protein
MFRHLGSFIKNQPIRFFALVCVAITSGYVMWMGWRLSNILTSPGWCNRTISADEVTSGTFDALQACVGLLGEQLKATALNSHIYAGTIALCLLALMVIVVAGGHLSFQAPGGFGGSVGAGEAADKVADAALNKAEEIKEGEA